MQDVISKINQDAEARMAKSVEALRLALDKVRTGRAHAGLLDHIQVEYYGSRTPLNQVANIAVADARALAVTPFDKSMAQAIEKAIQESGLGLNPVVAGHTVRVPLPVLTEERRKELGKAVRNEGEEAKIAIRNVRRDGITHLKEALKKKEISEDDEKRAHDVVQKLTDRFTAEVDKLVVAKDRDLMAI